MRSLPELLQCLACSKCWINVPLEVKTHSPRAELLLQWYIYYYISIILILQGTFKDYLILSLPKFQRVFFFLAKGEKFIPKCIWDLVFSHVWLFATLWTVARQVPLSMGLSWQEYWSGLPFPPPGDLPNPGNKPASPVAPVLAGGFFTTEPPGKPQIAKKIWKRKTKLEDSKSLISKHITKSP